MINCIFLPYGQFYYNSASDSNAGILVRNDGMVTVLGTQIALSDSRQHSSVEHQGTAENWADSDNLPTGVNQFYSVFKC